MQRLDLLCAEALAVAKELDAFQIRMHPDGNFFAFFACPIPMRKQVQHWFLPPPRLVVVVSVLGEPAHIHYAKLRVDRRTSIRSGFAAIIETGPGESAGEPWAGSVVGPPLLGELRPWRMVRVVSTHPIPTLVSRVNTASGDGAGGLGADQRLPGVRGVIGLGQRRFIVKAHDVKGRGEWLVIGAVHGRSTEACGIQSVGAFLHGPNDLRAKLICLEDVLLVAHRPEEDCGVVAIALDHGFELRQTFLVGRHHARFAEH